MFNIIVGKLENVCIENNGIYFIRIYLIKKIYMNILECLLVGVLEEIAIWGCKGIN